MKPSTLLTACVVALTGLDNVASAKSFCAKKKRRPWNWRWEIHVDEVDNVEATCNEIWSGLGVQGKFCVTDVAPKGCQKSSYYENEKALHAWFKTTQLCQDHMVASAFFQATENKYGAITCELKGEDWWFDPEGVTINNSTQS